MQSVPGPLVERLLDDWCLSVCWWASASASVTQCCGNVWLSSFCKILDASIKLFLILLQRSNPTVLRQKEKVLYLNASIEAYEW